MTTTRLDSSRLAIRKVIRDARDKNKWRKIVRFRLWMPVVLQLLLIVAVAVYTTSRFPGFINHANVTSILLLAAPLALVAIGQTHALLVGYLDLSVGAMVTFGVVIASFVIGPDSSTAHVVLGVGVVFLAGLTLGLVNAGLVRGLKIPSIIATLATLSILSGISLSLRDTPGGIIDRNFTSLLAKRIGPIPIAFIVIVIGAGALDYWLHATGSGLRVRSTGFDEQSAKRSGVPTAWVRVRALVLSALFAALASFMVMTRSGIGNAQIGDSYALSSITAAVLGGAALSGGRATFIGGTVASVLLALIIAALPFLGLSAEHGMVITGVLVLLGIMLFQAGDIKELVKRNYKRARRRVIGSRPPTAAVDPRPLPVGSRLPRGADRTDADPGRHGDQPRPERGGLRDGRRPRPARDEIVAVGPGLQNGGSRGDRCVGHDRDAGLRRLPSPHLGGPPAQHRNRRSAGGEVRLHLVRPAQAGAGVPTRRRVHRRPALGARRDRRRDHHASSTGRTSRARRPTPMR